jgi:hypothetical protein
MEYLEREGQNEDWSLRERRVDAGGPFGRCLRLQGPSHPLKATKKWLPLAHNEIMGYPYRIG